MTSPHRPFPSLGSSMCSHSPP
uniref:Toc35 n=1 Tax=Arundo donax TaxID=35708 RepID=A0A0A9F0T9_ARUDO